jgi:hypothetical protein
MENVPPPAQYAFVPFQEARLQQDDGRLLEGVVDACARAVATLGASRTTIFMVKGREVEDKLGRTLFKPLFTNKNNDTAHLPSLSCAGCGGRLQKVGLLCTLCKSLPVRLRAGPTLVDFAWEGSGKAAEMGKVEEEAMELTDQVFHFALTGVHFGKMLSNLSELAMARGPGECTDYPNVSLVKLELHNSPHFQYTIKLDKKTGEEITSVSSLIRNRVQVEARDWLVAVDGILCETQNDGAIYKLDEDDYRRLDRTCADLSTLIATHVSNQDDTTMHDRLCPACLEKKALCEFLRCSSKAMDQLRKDRDAMTTLLQAIAVFPDDAMVGHLPPQLTDFLIEGCPPELISVLPRTVNTPDVPCRIFSNFLVEALRRLDDWKPPSESSVRFPSTVIAKMEPAAGAKVLPSMDWYHMDTCWTVRRWPPSNRSGLDAAGVRVVRLISTVWGMHAAGAFEPGAVDANALHAIGETYAGRCAAVREWAVQILQPTLLRANLVDAKATICSAPPEVEDEVDDCISSFSNLALDEVLTLTSPKSSLYRRNYWRIADLAASKLAVRLPQEFYRDFVRVILPMAVAHLGEKRFRRGMPIFMRSNWISDALFLEPAIFEIVKVARSGEALPPVIFVPSNVVKTSKGRKTLQWLSDQPRRFVRTNRIGIERLRGFEVVVSDLLRVLYPSS